MKLIKENTILYFKFMSSKFKNSLKKGAFSNKSKVVKVQSFHQRDDRGKNNSSYRPIRILATQVKFFLKKIEWPNGQIY